MYACNVFYLHDDIEAIIITVCVIQAVIRNLTDLIYSWMVCGEPLDIRGLDLQPWADRNFVIISPRLLNSTEAPLSNSSRTSLVSMIVPSEIFHNSLHRLLYSFKGHISEFASHCEFNRMKP